MIYAVGYKWEDMCNTQIFITEFVTEDFKKVIEFLDQHNNVDWVIKKWFDGKVIGEIAKIDGTYKDLEIN